MNRGNLVHIYHIISCPNGIGITKNVNDEGGEVF